MSALNVHESPKFLHFQWNRGRGTQWWKYGRFVHAWWKICNITVIIVTVRSLWTWL